MLLHHFTSIAKLPDIMRVGQLMLSESHLSPKRRMAGPPVVWLTKSDDPTKCGLKDDETLRKLTDYALIDKTRIRITVELPRARVTRYLDWAKGQGINRAWLAHIMSAGGVGSWFVASRPITMDCWTEIQDIQENKVIWLAGPRPPLHGAAAIK